MKTRIISFLQKLLALVLKDPIIFNDKSVGYSLVRSQKANTTIGISCSIKYPCDINKLSLGDYSYIARNSYINNLIVGKFCSIGPNFCCGLGVHPTNGISTAPMFYSTAKQNGMTLCTKSKVEESKLTEIGHDVFIGANVTVLDGVKIGNGAVIGAGAVVTKDIPDFAIAVGVPAKVVKYRFTEGQREKLQKIEWWNKDQSVLRHIEEKFFDIECFLQ